MDMLEFDIGCRREFLLGFVVRHPIGYVLHLGQHLQ
jgi:hypothetical protein